MTALEGLMVAGFALGLLTMMAGVWLLVRGAAAAPASPSAPAPTAPAPAIFTPTTKHLRWDGDRLYGIIGVWETTEKEIRH